MVVSHLSLTTLLPHARTNTQPPRSLTLQPIAHTLHKESRYVSTFLPVILLLWKHNCIHWLPHVHMLHLRFEMERVIERIEEGVAIFNVLLIKVQGSLYGHLESYVDTNFSITKVGASKPVHQICLVWPYDLIKSITQSLVLSSNLQ